MSSRRAIFLDRDGTVIVDRGYLRDPAGIEPLPGALDALRLLRAQEWKLFLISNQSGVGRKLMTIEEMDSVQRHFVALMQGSGIDFEACYLCTHAPEDACECRKPATHFIARASAEHSVDPALSWMIGDRESDIVCGRNAGCRTILLRNPEFAVPPNLPDFTADSWSEISRRIAAG